MNKAFVVSDIHGMYGHFIKLLEHWNRDDKLIILGDMIDRGPDSLKVIQHVMELKANHDVIVLQGNHDQMIKDFVKDPLEHGELYTYHNGGGPTIHSLAQEGARIYYMSNLEKAELIKQKCKQEIEFLEQGRLYYEFGKVLFTHAGFCSWRDCWEETTDNQFVWIRDHYKHKNNTGLVNVFGHTPTQLINKDKSNDIWVSEDKTYIGIDGACAYGGQLNGILINENGELLDSYNIRVLDNNKIRN
ncbi:metallophosphoesterase [Solibacillus silvestris]